MQKTKCIQIFLQKTFFFLNIKNFSKIQYYKVTSWMLLTDFAKQETKQNVKSCSKWIIVNNRKLTKLVAVSCSNKQLPPSCTEKFFCLQRLS